MFVKWFSLILGSSLGGMARYLLAGMVHQLFGPSFPYGTLTVNMLGCFLIGLLTVAVQERLLLNVNAQMLFIVGFCGAFTTFSAFIFETSQLIRQGQTFPAFINVAISVAAGFMIFRLGVWLGEALLPATGQAHGSI